MEKLMLSNDQLLGLLVANFEELKSLFKLLPKFKVKDGAERSERIIIDLEYLITKGLGFEITEEKISKLFNSIG